jgi:hypothetical protein
MLRQCKPQCPKRERAMEEGFIPDIAYGAVLLGSWVEGTPEKGWTGSVKMTQTRHHHLPLYAMRIFGVVCEPLANSGAPGATGIEPANPPA